MFLYRFMLIAVVSFLAGCAAPGISKDTEIGKDPSKGLVIVSLTYSGSYSNYVMALLNKDGSNRTVLRFPVNAPVFPVSLLNAKADISTKEIEGNVYVLELPAGEYLLNTWFASDTSRQVSSRGPLNLPFPVVAGKTTYLGNIYFDFEFRRGKDYQFNVKLEDQITRDVALAQTKYPVMKDRKIDLGIPANFVVEYLGVDIKSLDRYPKFEAKN
jgi:hypothetical protein